MLKRELKINLKSLIIWLTIMLLLFGVVFLIYPNMFGEDLAVQMNQMMEMFPKEMVKAFNLDIVNISTAFGWIKTEGYVFLCLVGGVYASILGATILLKEESNKTIIFLLSKPVSRNSIVTSKIISGVINILIFSLGITLFNYIGLSIIEEFNVKQFFEISLSPVLLYLLLFFVSLFISTFLRKTKVSTTIALAVTFISYLMQMVGSMSEKIDFLRYGSFFEFVSSRYIIENNTINFMYLGIGIVLIIVLTLGTYINYNKKEFY